MHEYLYLKCYTPENKNNRDIPRENTYKHHWSCHVTVHVAIVNTELMVDG